MPVKALLQKIDHGLHWMALGREPSQKHIPPEKRIRNFKILSVLALIALVLQSGLLFLALFEPGLPYRVSRAPAERLDDPHFVQTLEALTGAHLFRAAKFDVLTNGEVFYPAMLDAIGKAQRSINLEVYIFSEGEVGDAFVRALAERARAGVQVNVIVDAIGGLSLRKSYFRELTDAGGEVFWYHPLRWYTWPRINNRTHRELLIIDGTVGFTGGAGIADHWMRETRGPRWRDMMVRVDGDAVTGLQATFAANWLEASGEILTGYDYFLFPTVSADSVSLVVGSSPTAGRSTSARVLFQTLLASANRSILITSPYFIPDNSARGEIIRALERGVDVQIIVPGDSIDHQFVRKASRGRFGDLLRAGAKIYEYQPGMNHTKSLVVDGLWSVVGSTNFDSRSFAINDEVNLAVMDPAMAERLTQDFHQDRSQSELITLDQWENRPYLDRIYEFSAGLFARQQ